MGGAKKKTRNSGGSAAAAAVQVALRVRPVNDQELKSKTAICIKLKDSQTCILEDPKSNLKRTFQYNYCYGAGDVAHKRSNKHSSSDDAAADKAQQQIYSDLGLQVLDNAFEGYNTCIFAYGQTGSGKTYTVFGDKKDPGVVPRICQGLFERIAEQKNTEDPQNDKGADEDDIKLEIEGEEASPEAAAANEDDKYTIEKVEIETTVTCSMVELYNEKFFDLLGQKTDKDALPLRDDPKKGPYIERLSVHKVHSEGEIAELLKRGNRRKIMASTNSNARSSRSHTIFQIHLVQTRVVTSNDSSTPRRFKKRSRINLVDLAGSERVAKTGASGERFKEGVQINLSLSALGSVIHALSANSRVRRRKTYVNYRASKLTHLMKDSLGGNSKTIMIATISPSALHFSETRSTLLFATRANAIINRGVKVNERDDLRKLLHERNQTIIELRAQIDQLRDTIANKTSDVDTQALAKEDQRRRVLISKLQTALSELSAENERLYEVNETFEGHSMNQFLHATGFARPTHPHLIYLYSEQMIDMHDTSPQDEDAELDVLPVSMSNNETSPEVQKATTTEPEVATDEDVVKSQDTTSTEAKKEETFSKTNVEEANESVAREEEATEDTKEEPREEEGKEDEDTSSTTCSTVDAAPHLEAEDENLEEKRVVHAVYTFSGETTTIGTNFDVENDILLPGTHLPFAARIDASDLKRVTIAPQDVDTNDNLFLNGTAIMYATSLTSGDHVQLGAHHFQYMGADAPTIVHLPHTATVGSTPQMLHFGVPPKTQEAAVVESEPVFSKALYAQYASSLEAQHETMLHDVEMRYQQALLKAEAERDRALVKLEQTRYESSRHSLNLNKRASTIQSSLEAQLAQTRAALVAEQKRSIWSRLGSSIKRVFKRKKSTVDTDDETDESWDDFEVVEEIHS